MVMFASAMFTIPVRNFSSLLGSSVSALSACVKLRLWYICLIICSRLVENLIPSLYANCRKFLIHEHVLCCQLIRRPVDFFSSYVACDETDDVVEESTLQQFSRRGSVYKKKPFRPQLEDIHEEEEMTALNLSSSDTECDDNFVVFKGGTTNETTNAEKPLEFSLRSSLLGIDFW